MRKIIIPGLLIFLVCTLLSCTGSQEPQVLTIENSASLNSQLPFLYTDNTGQLYLNWVEPGSDENEHKLLFSKFENDGWSSPQEIIRSSDWFVNWADFPSLIGYNGNPLAAHQLRKTPGSPYSYEIDLTIQTQSSWGATFTPHLDNTATEHGFVSMTPMNDHSFLAIWLDGRQTEERSDEDYFNLDKAMTLRSATIDTGGSVTNRELIDDSVCDCCPTSMVMTDEGPVAAYRNRTDDEIRDIFVSRYIDGSWTTPDAVYNDNWKIGACPVNGPKLSSDGSTVGLAWYTAADGIPAVKVARSSDYGATFGDPVTIHNGSTLGRVDVVIAGSETAYVSEINKRGEYHHLTVHRVSFDTGELRSFEVAKVSGSRNSGFPQMEWRNDELVFAWTEVAEDNTTSLKTARLKNL